MPENPFFTESTLPYSYPPFDRIRDEHFIPAFERGIAEHQAEVEAIASNPEAPTFENTVAALERSGQMLRRVAPVFDNLKITDENETLKAIDREMAPKLAAHLDAIILNAKLFGRIRLLFEQRKALGVDAESVRLLEVLHRNFALNGALLSDERKSRLKALNGEMAKLMTSLMQAIQAGRNASDVVVEDPAELEGLNDEVGRKLPGGGRRIPITNTTDQDILPLVDSRSLRRRILETSMSRGLRGDENDTQAGFLRLVQVRAEIAELLGYSSYADFHAADQMSASADAILGFLESLRGPALSKAGREGAAIQSMMDRHGAGTLSASDWSYFSEKVRKDQHSFDDTELRPYLELNRVLEDGVFYSANRLFGLSFKERRDLPVYHPEVRVYEVFDCDGRSMALFLTDFFARPSKRGGAWMNSYVDQSRLLGRRPVIGNHMNVPKPEDGKPALLTFDHVTTLFHEFGHALHGLLSDVTFPTLSGTNVPADFVEFPSQIYEMWTSWPEVVERFARHHETGEPMPKALFDKMLATRNFDSGFATLEYLKAALLDHGWHRLKPGEVPSDLASFEAAALARHGVSFEAIPPRYRSSYFSHAVSDQYAGRYYAYIWADMLVADAIEWFRSNGGLCRETGDRLRAWILSKGSTVDPMALYEGFSGRKPDSGALIRRRGLVEAGN
jgi:peptidyl-dipeptidase Dcp